MQRMPPPLKRKRGLAFGLGAAGEWVGDGGVGLLRCGGFGCPPMGVAHREGSLGAAGCCEKELHGE